MNKESYKATIDMRHKINLELYNELGALLCSGKDLRFGQAVSLFFHNDTNERMTEFESVIFNEEPAVTYARYKNNRSNND